MKDLTLLFGWGLGISSILIVDWLRDKWRRKSLLQLLRYEIQENVDLLETASASDDRWPAFLLSDVYNNNLGYAHLLTQQELGGILLHYKHVQRFELALRDRVELDTGGPGTFEDRAKEDLESGKKALELLN